MQAKKKHSKAGTQCCIYCHLGVDLCLLFLCSTYVFKTTKSMSKCAVSIGEAFQLCQINQTNQNQRMASHLGCNTCHVPFRPRPRVSDIVIFRVRRCESCLTFAPPRTFRNIPPTALPRRRLFFVPDTLLFLVGAVVRLLSLTKASCCFVCVCLFCPSRPLCMLLLLRLTMLKKSLFRA